MKFSRLLLTVVAGVSSVGCSDPSMFEKCMTKEVKVVHLMSPSERADANRQHGAPYYNADVAQQLDRTIAVHSAAMQESLEPDLNIYRTSPESVPIIDSTFSTQQAPKYQSYLKQFNRYLDWDITQEEFDGARDACGAACDKVEESFSALADYYDTHFPEVYEHYELLGKRQSAAHTALKDAIEAYLLTLPFRDLLAIAETTGVMTRWENKAEKAFSEGERSSFGIASETKDLAKALTTMPNYPIAVDSSVAAQAERYKAWFKGPAYIPLREKLAPFVEAVPASEIAVSTCNERGLYK